LVYTDLNEEKNLKTQTGSA